jgi:AcrR family transcriptional regulator
VLVDNGLHAVELSDIARRAGVGKTTVYRRWGSVPSLVADLLQNMAEESVSRTETGAIDGDLQANARLIVKTLSDPRQGALFAAIIAAATCDSDTATQLQRFYDVRLAEWAPCVEQAVARGELPAGTDPVAVLIAVSGPLYYRHLTRTLELSEDDAMRAAAAAVAAARAGVFVVDE